MMNCVSSVCLECVICFSWLLNDKSVGEGGTCQTTFKSVSSFNILIKHIIATVYTYKSTQIRQWYTLCWSFIIQSSNWVILRVFGLRTSAPTHVKIYRVYIYVIVWVDSVFPWLLEGLTVAWIPWSPSSRMSGSWMQQEKGFCWSKGLLVPPSMEPSHLEEAVGSVVCVR